MTCICKLKVDKLKEALEHLKNNVAGLPALIPNLSALASLAENAAANPTATVPVTSLTATATPTANLSASEAATVAAAAQLSETASLQATLQAQLGVNLTSPSAPCALGGLIEAAQVSGLISVLEFVANFNVLNPLGAVATAITAIADTLGIDLLEDKSANYMADNMELLAKEVEPPQKDDKDSKGTDNKSDQPPSPPEPPDTDLSDKTEDELPGMIGDAVRKMGEYLSENPNVNVNGLANDNLLSIFNVLVTDLDESELQDLINKVIEKTKRDFASHKDKSSGKKDATTDTANTTTQTDATDSNSTETKTTETDKSITDTKNKEEEDDDEIPSVNALLEKMVHHDMTGRTSWDQKKVAKDALKKMKELEDLDTLKEPDAKQDIPGLIERLIEKTKGSSYAESETDSTEQLVEKIKALTETEEEADLIDQLVEKIQESPETENATNSTGSADSVDPTGTGDPTEQFANDLKEKFKAKSTDGSSEQAVEAAETENTATTYQPKTPESELSDLVKETQKTAKGAIANSVKASNAAAKASNLAGLMIQQAFTNPAISPDAINLLKDSVTKTSKFAAKGSEAMTNALKAMKKSMANAAIGDLEAAKANKQEVDQNAAEATAACNYAKNSLREVADTANAIKAAEKEAYKNRGEQEEYESEEERQRVVANAVNSAVDSARKTFGGDISSASGLAVNAQAIAAININGPALTFVSAVVSEEMLIRAMAKLNIILLLGDVFGTNLFGPGGGASIAASLSLAASASVSASASVGAGASAGVSAGASAGAGAGAGASAGASAGVSASASASATAGLNGLSGLLAGTPPSPIALLLLTGILAQLAALGHNVVAFTPCSLAMEAMAKDEPVKDDDETTTGDDENDDDDEEEDDDNTENNKGTEKENESSDDDTNSQKSSIVSESDSNESDNDETSDTGDGQDNQTSTASDGTNIPSNISALEGIQQSTSWFQSARRKPLKLDSGKLAGLNAADAGNASMDLAGSADSGSIASTDGSPSSNTGSEDASDKTADGADDSSNLNKDSELTKDSTSVDSDSDSKLVAQNEAVSPVDKVSESGSPETPEKTADDDRSDQSEQDDSQSKKNIMAAGLGIGSIAGIGASLSGKSKQSDDNEDDETTGTSEDPDLEKNPEKTASDDAGAGMGLNTGSAVAGGIGIGGLAASKNEKTDEDDDVSWFHNARREKPQIDPEETAAQENIDVSGSFEGAIQNDESDSEQTESTEDDTWIHRARRNNPEIDPEKNIDPENADLEASLDETIESDSEQTESAEDDTWIHRARRRNPKINPEETDDTNAGENS